MIITVNGLNKLIQVDHWNVPEEIRSRLAGSFQREPVP